MRVASEIQSCGEGQPLRESPYCVSCTFEALAKQKMFLPKVAESSEKCLTTSGKVPGEIKTRLKKVYLLSYEVRTKYDLYMSF